jgi:hypothetical protein
MRTANKTVRQSVSLPANIAAQVRNLPKARRLSANRMLLELIENGMEAGKRKQQELFDLAERFRSARSSRSQTPGRSDGQNGLRRLMPKSKRREIFHLASVST